jgi:ribonuclease HI
MAKNTPKEAYVVFRGRVPGVYRTWVECHAQVNGFSKQKFRGFDSFAEASMIWEEWQRKSGIKYGIHFAFLWDIFPYVSCTLRHVPKKLSSLVPQQTEIENY